MFLFEPSRSDFDINFRLFGIPVRVHPTFWLFSAIFGWHYLERGFEYLLLWIGCMFVSILVHELGHVFMGLCFGRPSHVVLYAMGGLAMGDFQVRRRWQRVAISFAGPAAGLLLYGLIWLVLWYVVQPDVQDLRNRPLLQAVIEMVLWMNLIWSLFNLLPIWPLDGGHISRELFSGLFPGNGIRLSLGFSLLVAGLGAVYSLIVLNRPELPYLGIAPGFAALFLGLLAVESFLRLQQTERLRRQDGWERDPDVWG